MLLFEPAEDAVSYSLALISICSHGKIFQYNKQNEDDHRQVQKPSQASKIELSENIVKG